jgi:hypothetical protein
MKFLLYPRRLDIFRGMGARRLSPSSRKRFV